MKIHYCWLVLVLSSCLNLYPLDNDYTKYLEHFGKEFTSHFPMDNSIVSRGIMTIDTFAIHNSESFFITIKNNDYLFQKLKKRYRKQVNLKSLDSCLIVVNDFVTKENCASEFYGYKSYINTKCISKNHIIPNFWYGIDVDNKTKSKLSKNYIIYILKSKLGHFSDKIDYSKSSLPKSIYHGKSCGIALNERTKSVIYWVNIW